MDLTVSPDRISARPLQRWHAVWLEALVAHPGVEFTAFDFGVEFPIGTIVPMVDFPPDLVKAAGHIGLGLRASVYFFSTAEEASEAEPADSDQPATRPESKAR